MTKPKERKRKKSREFRLPYTPINLFYIDGLPFTFDIVTKTIGNTINVQLVLNRLEEVSRTKTFS